MLDYPTLGDDLVGLVPLELGHADALEAAAADGALGDLWYTSTPAPGEAAAYVTEALRQRAAGFRFAYAVQDRQTDRIVGATSFYDPEPAVPRLAIGYTWYAASVQQTHLNSACKRLMLTYAFETAGCVVVEFHTDFYNQASRRALERLGARQDGILRAHVRRPDGTLRDHVCFSILATEWSDVRQTLDRRIARALTRATRADPA